MRLNGKQLNIVKEKLGVNTLYSYSKISTFEQCLQLYFMKYIEHKHGFKDSCYTWFGTLAHELIQGYYDGEHDSHEAMLSAFNTGVSEWVVKAENEKSLRFSSDAERDKYIKNLQHYFANTELLDEDITNEKFILTEFFGNQKYAFQGYIDSLYQRKSDGKTVIMDYKTSSISGFSGEKLIEKSKQLFIYAIGLNQRFGIPFDDIIIVYDMMKYMKVSYTQKNGKVKETNCERSNWVGKMSNPIRKKFKEYNDKFADLQKQIDKLEKYKSAKCRKAEEIEQAEKDIESLYQDMASLGEPFSEDEIDEYMKEALATNTIDNLPQAIQDEFTFRNCFIEVEVNEETVKDMTKYIVHILDEIVERTETGSFERGRIEDSESFYCTNLCDLRNECPLYREYRENKNMFVDEEMSDDDLLAQLGL